jgi:hypothetical protein
VEVTDRYVEQVKLERELNDASCSNTDPAGGARYFLPQVSACASVNRASPQVLEVRCSTR